MEIFPPSTAKLVVQPTPTASPMGREERASDLQLHQMVRATVEEGGQDKALLQLGDRRLWVQTGSPLKAGDTLNLQVVETQPAVAFKIIEPNLVQRLGQALHLLGNQNAPGNLLAALQAEGNSLAKQLPPELRETLDRLLTLLQKSPEQLSGRDLAALPRQLGLTPEADLLAGRLPEARLTLRTALGQLGALQLLRPELGQMLEPLSAALNRLPQLLQTPAGADRLPDSLAAVLRPLLQLAQAAPGRESANGQAPPLPQTQFSGGVQQFVTALRNYLGPLAGLTGEALQQLERQAALLPQLPQATFGQALAAGGQPSLGNDLLNVLFLLFQRSPEQLAGSAGAPLARQLAETLQQELQRHLGQTENRQEDALRQLDLWQLCRARLADIDTSFIPLPLPFLDNGYLVARRKSSPEAEANPADRVISLSLLLELKKLGPLQVDLLYQNEKLFVRFKCHDQAAAATVSAAKNELGETLGGVPLSSVSVGLGAEAPERTLIQTLIPPEKGLLNARI